MLVRTITIFLFSSFFISTNLWGQCAGNGCSVCNVVATITNIENGTIITGESSINGTVLSTGGGAPFKVEATGEEPLNFTVTLDFSWQQGNNINWIHGCSLETSPNLTVTQGNSPPGWIYQESITGCCSGSTYGAGYYSDVNTGTSGCCGPATLGNAADNWGNPCNESSCPAFSFDLNYAFSGEGSTMESVQFVITDDGETGSWNQPSGCVFELIFPIEIISNCNEDCDLEASVFFIETMEDYGYDNCGEKRGIVTFLAGATIPDTTYWVLSTAGTATYDEDYFTLSFTDTLVLPPLDAGEDWIEIISLIYDNDIEGTETAQLIFESELDTLTVDFEIFDVPALDLHTEDLPTQITACPGPQETVRFEMPMPMGGLPEIDNSADYTYQWLLPNGNAIPSLTLFTIAPSIEGTYDYVFEVSDGCETKTFNLSVDVFMNPTCDAFLEDCEEINSNPGLIGSDLCRDAPLLTGAQIEATEFNMNTDFYMDESNDPTSGINNAGWCGGGFSIEANQWIKFIADGADFTVLFSVGECASNSGIQVGLFEPSPLTNQCVNDAPLNCQAGQSGSNTISFFHVSELISGNTYYLMMDSYNGEDCTFTIDILSGIDTSSGGGINNPDSSFVSAVANANSAVCMGIPSLTALDGLGSSSDTEPLDNIKYYWEASNGGNILSGQTSLNPVIDQGGTYALYVYDEARCLIDTAIVDVVGLDGGVPVAVNAGPSQTLNCNTFTAQLQADTLPTDFTYQWTSNTGNFVSGTDTPNPVVAGAGIYYLEAIAPSGGCLTNALDSVVVTQLSPAVFINPPSDINLSCGDPIPQITDLQYDNFDTQNPNTGFVAGVVSGTVDPCQGGVLTYEWMGTDACGTALSHTQTITVDPAPMSVFVNLPADISLTCGDPIPPLVPLAYTNCISPPGLVMGTQTGFLDPCLGGTIFYIWENLDACGMTLFHTQTITVNPAPSISFVNVPSDLTLFCGDPIPPIGDLTYSNNASGPCALEGIVSGNIASNLDECGGGTLLYSWEGSDVCGNPLVHIQTITVDCFAPTANAGDNQSINCINPSVQLDGSNSVGGTIYAWTDANGNFIADSPIISVDVEGSYYLSVSNPNAGCVSMDSVFVNLDQVVPMLDINSSGELTCANNTVTITATTDVQNLDYAWTTADGQIASGIDGTSIQVSSGGIYSLVVTNPTNGCTAQSSLVITGNSDLPTVNIQSSEVLNCITTEVILDGSGSSTGSNFTYEWQNSAFISIGTDQEISVNEAGIYSLIVTNIDNNCSSVASVEIVQNTDLPSISIAPVETLNCFNSTVILTVEEAPVTANYVYEWSNSSGASISNSPSVEVSHPDTYTLVLTNIVNACTASQTVEVFQSPDLVAELVVAQGIDCHGNQSGHLQADVLSGADPYMYEWSTGETTPTISNLAAGEYSLTLTDNQACSQVLTVTLTEPAALELTAVVGHETANGALDGFIESQVIGGTPPYAYDWSDGQASSSIDQLPTGTYMLTVTDDNGCTTTGTYVIQGFDCNLEYTASVQNVTCFGATDGGIMMNDAYFYAWSTNSTGSSLVNAPAGTYSVTISDAFNCSAIETIEITEPEELIATANYSDQILTCINQNPTVDIVITGGTPPYMYLWSDGSMNPEFPATIGASSVTVTDTNGCEDVVLVEFLQDITEPLVDIGGDMILDCLNSSAILNANAFGTANLSFAWAGPGGYASNLEEIMVSSAGTYCVTVTDTANGCTSSDCVAVLEDVSIPALAINPVDLLTCENEEVFISVANPNPNYVYEWYNEGGAVLSNNANLTTNSCGNYTLTATNTNGCTTSTNVQVECDISIPTANAGTDEIFDLTCNDPLPFPVTLNGNGSSTGTDMTYFWTLNEMLIPNSESLQLAAEVEGNFVLHVVNEATGCENTDTVLVALNYLDGPESTIASSDRLNCLNPSVTLDGQNSTGLGNLTYQWFSPMGALIGTQMTVEASSAGTYSLIVRDEFGCTDQSYRQVQADELENFFTNETPLCHDDVIGMTANVTGTNPPFSYLWETGESSPTTAFADGDELVLTVTDSLGCAWDFITEPVPYPSALTIQNVFASTETNNTSNAYIAIQANGGNLPHSFLWSTGSTSSTIYNLAQGFYTVTVTDANGCVIESDPIEVKESEPVPDFDPLDELVIKEEQTKPVKKDKASSSKLVVQLFPNPTKGELFVTSEKAVSDVRISVYNQLGQLVYVQKTDLTTAPTNLEIPSFLTNGMYLMHIQSKQGVAYEKVVLER